MQWYSGTVVQWCNDAVMQWYSGTVVQWCMLCVCLRRSGDSECAWRSEGWSGVRVDVAGVNYLLAGTGVL
jgi:hypothetical protein